MSVNRTVNPCQEAGCPYRAEYEIRRAPVRKGRRSDLPETERLCMDGVRDELMILPPGEPLTVESILQAE